MSSFRPDESFIPLVHIPLAPTGTGNLRKRDNAYDGDTNNVLVPHCSDEGGLAFPSPNDAQKDRKLGSRELCDDGSGEEVVDKTSRAVVDALCSSGFLLVTSPHLSVELQEWALSAASAFLKKEDEGCSYKNRQGEDVIVTHPTDPKTYAMLDEYDISKLCREGGVGGKECINGSSSSTIILREYMIAMQRIKRDVLYYIARGLCLDNAEDVMDLNNVPHTKEDVEDLSFLVKLHSEDNDTLRLINYYPVDGSDDSQMGNRCKEHSDYGTITLLSTDGISGLEAYHECEDDTGKWYPVPYVKGSVVVNIGSILSEWTKGKMLATLHRVAGPASVKSLSNPKDLIMASRQSRTSIAFFADPNKNTNVTNGMSISEYIKYRSGGNGSDRSGVGFTADEQKRVNGGSRR